MKAKPFRIHRLGPWAGRDADLRQAGGWHSMRQKWRDSRRGPGLVAGRWCAGPGGRQRSAGAAGRTQKGGQMDEIEAFRNRIGQSLAVIAEGIERLGQDVPAAPAPQADTAELVALRAMLEDERVVQAQLEERVRSLRERLERGTAEAESAAAAAQAEMAAMDQALQGLRQTTADLREVVGQLRAALAEEVAEPALVNRAMLAEIEALRAERAADLAEVQAVYGALRPLVREAM